METRRCTKTLSHPSMSAIPIPAARVGRPSGGAQGVTLTSRAPKEKRRASLCLILSVLCQSSLEGNDAEILETTRLIVPPVGRRLGTPFMSADRRRGDLKRKLDEPLRSQHRPFGVGSVTMQVRPLSRCSRREKSRS